MTNQKEQDKDQKDQDEAHIILNDEDWAKFMEMLANPPEPTEELKKLMKGRP